MHPKIQEIIDQTKIANIPPQRDQPIGKVRESFANLRLLAGDNVPVYKIVSESVTSSDGKVLLRFYYPKNAEKLPTLLYFHPGGFVKGDLESHDPICRMIANRSDCLVVSVGYRLAPEFPFPTAIEDGYYALLWLFENASSLGVDPDKIAVGGESSGGNIAAVLTHLSRDRKGPTISYQMLIYPMLDLTFSFPSHKELDKGYLLDESSLIWYREMYIGSEHDPKKPLISPLWFSNFSGLPPAFLLTCEFDPLKDEGKAYADKLQQAGIPIYFREYEGMTHGFFQMPGILDEASLAITSASESLKNHFSS